MKNKDDVILIVIKNNSKFILSVVPNNILLICSETNDANETELIKLLIIITKFKYNTNIMINPLI